MAAFADGYHPALAFTYRGDRDGQYLRGSFRWLQRTTERAQLGRRIHVQSLERNCRVEKFVEWTPRAVFGTGRAAFHDWGVLLVSSLGVGLKIGEFTVADQRSNTYGSDKVWFCPRDVVSAAWFADKDSTRATVDPLGGVSLPRGTKTLQLSKTTEFALECQGDGCEASATATPILGDTELDGEAREQALNFCGGSRSSRPIFDIAGWLASRAIRLGRTLTRKQQQVRTRWLFNRIHMPARVPPRVSVLQTIIS